MQVSLQLVNRSSAINAQFVLWPVSVMILSISAFHMCLHTAASDFFILIWGLPNSTWLSSCIREVTALFLQCLCFLLHVTMFHVLLCCRWQIPAAGRGCWPRPLCGKPAPTFLAVTDVSSHLQDYGHSHHSLQTVLYHHVGMDCVYCYNDFHRPIYECIGIFSVSLWCKLGIIYLCWTLVE